MTTPQNLEQLAYDLASGMYSLAQVCDMHALDVAALKSLLANDGFKSLVREYKEQWLNSDGADIRVQAKAKMVEEQALLPLHEIIQNRGASDSDRINAAKVIQISAAAGKRATGEAGVAGGASGVNVVINLNGERKQMVFDAQPSHELLSDASDG